MFDGDQEESPGNWRDHEEEYGEPDDFDPDDIAPDIPEAPDPSEVDVDPQVRIRFWGLVILFNISFLLLAVGLMFIAFEGNFDLGGKLAAVGALLTGYGYYRYLDTKRNVLGDDGDEDEDGASAEEESADQTAGNSDGISASAHPRPGDMRTVEADGQRYILLKESEEASLVRDPETGARSHLPNEEWETVEGESPLDAAAGAVPEAVQRVLTAVHDEQSLGLLLEIDERGPVAVRSLMAYDLCESDLHGLLAEFRAAGLVAEADVGGERGYETTERASRGLEALQARDGTER